MSGYSFYCSRCNVDHAGECPPTEESFFSGIERSVAPSIGGTYIDSKGGNVLDALSDLIKALEAGSYDAAPLKECQRTSPNDLCGPCDPAVCDHPFTYLCLADLAQHFPPGSSIYNAAELAFVNGNAQYVTVDRLKGTLGWGLSIQLPQPLHFIPITFNLP